MMTALRWLPLMVFLFVGAHCRRLGNRNLSQKLVAPPTLPDDQLEVVQFFLGNENENAEDGTAGYFTGVTAKEMITLVRIEFYESNGVRYIECVGFSYGDQDNNCPEEPAGVNQIHNFELDTDEYITNVSGESFMNILSIWFKTNKDREIGPYGTGSDPSQHDFQVSHEGAPLLYVDGYSGLWLYSLNFTFHNYTVLGLEYKANELASKSYEAIKTDIEDLYMLRDNYTRMHPDIARKGCALFGSDSSIEVQIACDLEVLLDQIVILTAASNNLQNHGPRNLLELKDYDSAKYLDEVQEAKNFHNLLTEIKFDLNTVINVTDQQSAELSEFFSATAAFDQEIAEQDLIFIQGQLETKSEGAQVATDAVSDRLFNILMVGISVAYAAFVEEVAQFMSILAAQLNPFKVVFGGIDVAELAEALEELMDAISNLVMFITLMAHLEEFVDHAEDISAKFAENQAAIDAMNELVVILMNETDVEVIQQHADAFIKSYGDYSPQVSMQDITYIATLLDAVGNEACTTLDAVSGVVSEAASIAYDAATLDCVYISADIAVLGSYFEDIYTLQFEMIDALTSIVKGEISVAMAGRIGSIETTIDVRTAAIGTAMVETTYQAASLGRCDILEYLAAGKRPSICKTLLFRDDDIQKLIAYVGSESSNERVAFGYIPTYPQGNITHPFINMTRLLRGEYQTLRLPIDDEAWLIDYNWRRSSVDPETAFYFELLEIYLPALKCNETGESIHTVNVQLLSGNPTPLYAEEAPPRYSIDEHLINFEYTEPSGNCAGDLQIFPVRDNETFDVIYEQEVCVISHGHVNEFPLSNDFTYPSMFTTYTIQVTSHQDCTLVEDTDALDFQPLVTVRYSQTEVFATENDDDPGLDECWPEDSRCPPDEWCVDGLLEYCCQDSEGVCD